MTALIDVLPVFNFGEQRAKCEACANLRYRVLDNARAGRTVVPKCIAAKDKAHRSCSLMRAPGQACGPEAKLFEPKAPA